MTGVLQRIYQRCTEIYNFIVFAKRIFLEPRLDSNQSPGVPFLLGYFCRIQFKQAFLRISKTKKVKIEKGKGKKERTPTETSEKESKMATDFYKYHALGNDYIVMDPNKTRIALTQENI